MPDSGTSVFLWIVQNFYKTYFEEHLRTPAFDWEKWEINEREKSDNIPEA